MTVANMAHNVPDDILLRFMNAATTMLLELDCAKECQGLPMTLEEGRQRLLDLQRSKLSQEVYAYNENKLLQVQLERVHKRLATMRGDETTSPEIDYAMESMDDAARFALVRLVLYSESKEENDPILTRDLKSEGDIERSKLLEFIALMQTTCKLPEFRRHLKDGTPIFEDVPYEETESSMRFPQARMERIQRLLARAVGYEPELVARELRRIFFDLKTSQTSEYAKDLQVRLLFDQLVSQMSNLVTNVSLESSQSKLSDVSDGGVTRVVSVSYSEYKVDTSTMGVPGQDHAVTSDDEESCDTNAAMGAPPQSETMSTVQEARDTEQKRQLRLANEAALMQQAILEELMALPDEEREKRLAEAQRVSNEFLRQAMALPVGPERVRFLQEIDPNTQKLLALNKIWNQATASSHVLPSVGKSQPPQHEFPPASITMSS